MLIYGKNVVNEILNKNSKINKVFLDNNFNDETILKKIDDLKLKKFHMDRNKLDKMASSTNTQGIVLDIDEYKYLELDALLNDKESNFIVMLDSLEDPHNFGAIIRTCECAGVNYIIIPKRRSVGVNSTVYKTSSGALANVKIIEVSNLNNTMEKVKKEGYWIYGAEAKGVDYKSVDYGNKVCLIIGSEGRGLKEHIQTNCDMIVSLPMKGKINSLNASVASGILIYEIMSKL